jgi:hypothetical protein
LQIARYNQLYYQKRAGSFGHFATSANIIAAVAASAVFTNLLSSSKFGWGQAVWVALTLLAALAAAIVPVLHLDARASQMGKLAMGHSIIFDRVRQLLSDLKLSKIDNSHLARYKEIEAFGSALAPLDEPPSERLREKCWKMALEEFPSEQAWTII